MYRKFNNSMTKHTFKTQIYNIVSHSHNNLLNDENYFKLFYLLLVLCRCMWSGKKKLIKFLSKTKNKKPYPIMDTTYHYHQKTKKQNLFADSLLCSLDCRFYNNHAKRRWLQVYIGFWANYSENLFSFSSQ